MSATNTEPSIDRRTPEFVEDAIPDPEPAAPSLPEPDPGVFHHTPGGYHEKK